MTYEWLKKEYMNKDDEEPPSIKSLQNYMDNFKDFLKSKQAKRFYWTMLNAVMGLIVSYISYMAGLDVKWALTILPVATGLSQALTKELNNRLQ